MNRDRDLTILLTLKDRAAYTFRWLAYAERIRLPFKVLIADGGADESVPQALVDHTRFPNVDYEYVRYPYDASYADYYAKIVNALNRVQTPYVVMADNDDFFFTRALRESLAFLSTHPDYAACGGYGATFWLESSPGDREDSAYGRALQWKCAGELRSLEGGSASERVRELAFSGADSFYDVKRTADARTEFAVVRDLSPSDLFLMEPLVVFQSAIAGKTRRLDTLYIARQHDSPGSSGGDHERKYGDWFGRMLVDTWSREFTQFLDVTSAALSAVDGIPVETARERMRDAYRMAVAPCLLSDLMNEPTVTPLMPVSTALVRYLVALPKDSALRNAMRWLYRRARWVPKEVLHGTAFIKAQNREVADEFASIRAFLTRRP